MITHAAILLPATRIRPPALGHPLYTVAEVLSVYCGRRLWSKTSLWVAGDGKVLPLSESHALPRNSDAPETPDKLEMSLREWCNARWEEGQAVVVYCDDDAPMAHAVRRLIETPTGSHFICTVWCDKVEFSGPITDVRNDPDFRLCHNTNLSRLVRTLDHMLLTPEDWTLAEAAEKYTPESS